jgi:hypothetical protein
VGSIPADRNLNGAALRVYRLPPAKLQSVCPPDGDKVWRLKAALDVKGQGLHRRAGKIEALRPIVDSGQSVIGGRGRRVDFRGNDGFDLIA